VCYQSRPEYDAEACAVVFSQWTGPKFHADNPISIDYPLWANNSCNPISLNGTSLAGDPLAGAKGCTQGRYPVYVVNATTAAHVQATFDFAKRWNVRLNIKNTGHSLPGR